MYSHLAKVTIGLGAAALFLFAGSSVHPGEPAKPKYSVKVQDDKTVTVDMEDSGAIDPVQRIKFGTQGNFFINVNTMQGQTLHLSHFPNFMINGRFLQPGQGGRFEAVNKALPPKTVGGKPRIGSSSVWVFENLRITQTLELVPSRSKGAGQKRLLNAVMITYGIENTGTASQNVAMRVYMDTFVINNDGCLFAAPVTHPGKLLDGMVLQEKTLPPYLQMLQIPDLKNPGYVAHLSVNMGSKFEKANKLILTRHGAGFGAWEMPAMPSMGDSAIGIYFATKEIKPGGKRELAYAYGEGVAVSPESEGRYQIALGGSFEPGKIFTVSAVVADPVRGQTLTLELPAGMERLEGKEVQPVAALAEEQEYSTVLWKARVVQPGQHTIRIRSSTGVTQAKIVSITAEK